MARKAKKTKIEPKTEDFKGIPKEYGFKGFFASFFEGFFIMFDISVAAIQTQPKYYLARILSWVMLLVQGALLILWIYLIGTYINSGLAQAILVLLCIGFTIVTSMGSFAYVNGYLDEWGMEIKKGRLK